MIADQEQQTPDDGKMTVDQFATLVKKDLNEFTKEQAKYIRLSGQEWMGQWAQFMMNKDSL